MRLALFVFACGSLGWLLTTRYVVDPIAEWLILTRAMGVILFDCVAYWLYYIAVEPYVRRLWPQTLVSWSRLLAGRVRDPLIGRDLLVGLLAGQLVILLTSVLPLGLSASGSPRVSTASPLDTLATGRALAGGLPDAAMLVLQTSFLFLVSLLLLRIVIRSRVLLGACFVALQTAVYMGLVGMWLGGGLSLTSWLVLMPFMGVMALIIFEIVTRFGLLALAAMLLPIGLGLFYPVMTPSLSAWHAGVFLLPVLVLAGLAAYGFHTAIAGQPLFKDEILAP